MSNLEFKGYAVTDKDKFTDSIKLTEFQPKNFGPNDVELAISHCGVCGSDVHTLSKGWGDFEAPLIAGHEIVGQVTRVGDAVQEFKPGDRVGVGAQIWCCKECRACKTNNEQYCPKQVDTYNATYEDGVKTQGGYSTAIRADERFVFKIPDAIESRYAASMLCAGLTVFSPLKRNGCGPGKKVGIIGIGGLGHYALLFAKAMGAEVFAITHDNSKEADIKKMGADHIINISADEKWAEKYALTFDLLLSTRDVAEDFPIKEFMSTLWIHGKFVTVGLPDEPFPQLAAFDFVGNGAFIGGSHVGSKVEVMEMLQLAADKGIKPWIEEMPMKDVKIALENLRDNKVRYRYVLTQDIVLNHKPSFT